MTDKRTSIAYLSSGSDTPSRMAEALRAVDELDVREETTPLAKLNGHGLSLAQSNDIIIFDSGEDTEEDAKAVETLRSSCPKGASIFAVASGTASLADVKRLISAGVDDVLLDTMTPEDLSAQIAKWRAQAAPVMAPAAETTGEGKVISVARSRGGIGGTTVAVNLAHSLAGRTGTFKKGPGKKVAIVDLDIQFGSVASLLDMQQSDAVYQMILDGTVPDETFMEQICQVHQSGLTVLSSPSQFVPMEALKAEQIGKVLDILKRTHDFVIVDMPRALMDWLSAVIERSDHLLLVTDSSVPSIQQCKRLIDVYTSDALSLDIRIVVNHEKKPLIRPRHIAEAMKLLEREFSYWLPFDPKSAREASDRGVPVTKSVSSSVLAKSLSRLSRSFAEPGQSAKSQKKKST